MRLACLADVSADADGLLYRAAGDGEDGPQERRSLAPADATACAFALAVKRQLPDTHVEVVAIGPSGAIPGLEDILRLGADQVTLLSDPAFAGSDALVRSRILAAYLRGAAYDCVLAGAHTADGAAAEVPSQVAELLALPQLSDIVRVDMASLAEGQLRVDADEGRLLATYQIRLPAVLSLKHDRHQALPYVSLRDARTDVRHRLRVLDREQLGLAPGDIGAGASLTRVVGTVPLRDRSREPLVVGCDADGIEQVHAFLQRRGLV